MQRSYTAARGKKFLPRLRKRGGFDFACDASLELGMKNGACSVNHDHVFCAFSTNRVRHARWNYDPDVVVATMIIAINKETHHAPGKTRSDVAQNYLNATLQKEHHIPLLVIVTAERIILRLVHEQAAQPIRCISIFWNAGRMHVETFCRVCKH